MKKTPLYQTHLNLGAKMAPFAGFDMPIQYQGIVKEHTMVREACGIFDVSHMGEIEIKGTRAGDFIQYLFTNDFSSLEPGGVRYSPMCNENGGCVDDVVVYKFSDEHFMLVVNAANKDKDFHWILEHQIDGVAVNDISDTLALLAVQGLKAKNILAGYFNELPEDYYTFISIEYSGAPIVISRTGYTGEDGFEIYCKSKIAETIFNEILTRGGQDITPCGLGARDTLRLECAMPLYGQELGDDISPLEAGLMRFTKLDKSEDFIGKAALMAQKESGEYRKRYGFVLIDRGIARHGDAVYLNDKNIGMVTSGTKSITLQKAIGLALVDNRDLKPGDTIEIEVRDKKLAAEVVKLPFYKRNY